MRSLPNNTGSSSALLPPGWPSTTDPTGKHDDRPRSRPLATALLRGALASGFATSVTCTRCGDTIGTTREAFENIRVRQRHYFLGTLLGEAIRVSTRLRYAPVLFNFRFK